MPTDRITIPFCGQSYKGKNTFLNSEQCINYFPEILPTPQGEVRVILRGAPGLENFCDLGSGSGIRGWCVAGDYLYVVSGNGLYKVSSTGVVAPIAGTMTLTETMVDVITNGVQVGIFGGANGYVYTIGGALAQITDGDFPGATTATYQDGFALIQRPNTAQFFKSALNDFTSWGALDFSSAGWKPHNLIRVFSDHRFLWLMCKKGSEIWYNTGAATFPFSRREGGEIELGLAATRSVVATDNGVHWISETEDGDGMIMQALNFQPKVISTTPIMEALKSYSTISDAIGFSYQFDGHMMVEWVFPTAGKSWVYDSTTRLWHERQSYYPATGLMGIHRIRQSIYFANKNLVGSATDGKIYNFTRSIYNEAGTDMPAIRVSQPLVNNEDLITFNELHMLFTPGVGLAAGSASELNPQVQLSWSDDGGYTWSSEINVPLGANTAYSNRAVAYRLGQGRNRLFKLCVVPAVNRDLFGAFARIEIDSK